MMNKDFSSPAFDETTIWQLFEKWANDDTYMPNTEENNALNVFKNYVLGKTTKQIAYYLFIKAGDKPSVLPKKDIEDLSNQLFTLWQARLLVKIRNGNTKDKTESLLFIFNKARKNLIKEVLEFNQITKRVTSKEGKSVIALVESHKELTENHIEQLEKNHINNLTELDQDAEADFNWFIERVQLSVSGAEYKWIIKQKAFNNRCLEDDDFARLYNSDFAKFLEKEEGKEPTNARRIKSENRAKIINCLATFCKSNTIEEETALAWFHRLFFLFFPIFSHFNFIILLNIIL